MQSFYCSNQLLTKLFQKLTLKINILLIILSFIVSMGANNQPATNESQQTVVLKLRNRDIILHHAYKMKLTIGDIDIFPHGMGGLRLWDASIILARYIIIQNHRFQNKDVLELIGGTAIASVACRKWTTTRYLGVCDLQQQIINNMKKNCEKNSAGQIDCFKLEYEHMEKYTKKVDSIISGDILSTELNLDFIKYVYNHFLKPGGTGTIVMTHQKQAIKKFKQLLGQNYDMNIEKLTEQEYDMSPLFNKVEGEEQFPQIGNQSFVAVIFKRNVQSVKEEKKEDKVQSKQQEVKEEKQTMEIENQQKQKQSIQQPDQSNNFDKQFKKQKQQKREQIEEKQKQGLSQNEIKGQNEQIKQIKPQNITQEPKENHVNQQQKKQVQSDQDQQKNEKVQQVQEIAQEVIKQTQPKENQQKVEQLQKQLNTNEVNQKISETNQTKQEQKKEAEGSEKQKEQEKQEEQTQGQGQKKKKKNKNKKKKGKQEKEQS